MPRWHKHFEAQEQQQDTLSKRKGCLPRYKLTKIKETLRASIKDGAYRSVFFVKKQFIQSNINQDK